MKIAIIGYGRMGREIEKIALEKGHEIAACIDHPEEWDKNLTSLKEADVAIEFSTAGSAAENIMNCFNISLPVVCGTTGWLDQADEIKNICEQKNQSFFYAPNFSIGVYIFFELNKYLAKLMDHLHGYDVSIEETHHIHKADAPSGTAIKLADDIVKETASKKRWIKTGKPGKDEIGITSIREGNITGSHTVTYESDFDKIEIAHHAKSRQVFAAGAVMAAEWLPGKTGIFGMHDIIAIGHK
jgi:4-hydroxy-tetrahydrodipicolinate reductase